MNSYDRRLVHNAFKDDPQVMSYSPPDDARLKRITLSLARRLSDKSCSPGGARIFLDKRRFILIVLPPAFDRPHPSKCPIRLPSHYSWFYRLPG